MGQGRKKGQQGYGRHHRRRSITVEVENQDNQEIMHFIGPAAVMRSRFEMKPVVEARNREPTPYPRTIDERPKGIIPVVLTKKSREATSSSPTNVCASCEIPSLVTCSVEQPLQIRSFSDSAYDLLVRSFFKNSWIIQNEQRREVTDDSRRDLSKIFGSLFELVHTDISLTEVENPDFLISVFSLYGDQVVRFLVNGCRFERIYGLSHHIAILDILLSLIPDFRVVLHFSIYETLLEFYEEERENGIANEDSLYVKETSYGQIHRIVELWSSCVNILYISYFSFINNPQDGDVSYFRSSSDILLRSGYILLQLSSVVQKYKNILESAFMKLMCFDSSNAHSILRVFNSKLPITSPRKLIGWLELISDLLDQCPIFLNPEYKHDIQLFLGKVMKLASGSHIDCALQSLLLLKNRRLIIHFILSSPDLLKMMENCLHLTQNHWFKGIRDKGEELFDVLLDCMEA